MSDQHNQHDNAPPADHRVEDIFLRLFVSLANDGSISVSITVNMGGLLIGGMLVGIDEWIAGIGAQLSGANAGFGQGFLEGVQGLPEEGDDPANRPPPAFIHLRNARIGPPGGPLMTVEWWRGRLDAVDGWFLGQLS